MGQLRGLIDSNVLVAAASVRHLHHEPSFDLINFADADDFAISAHSLSEFFNISTRNPLRGGTGMSPNDAVFALAELRSTLVILTLTLEQHIDAIESFAALGGTGARLYDYLIGQVAVVHHIPTIVTWNVAHIAPLFSNLRVVTPVDAVA